MGFSLNNLTLMALTISTGFVVDDAIVMIENISRYIERGDSPLQAALKGSQADRVHHSFAVHLAHRRADSAAVHGRRRRSTVPGVRRDAEHDDRDFGHRLTDPDADDVRPPAALPTRHGAGRVLSMVSRPSLIGRSPPMGGPLRWVLNHQPATLTVAIVTLVVTILLYVAIPKGFFPVQDTGVLLGISEAPQSISFVAMVERQQALVAAILAGSGRREPVVLHRSGRHQHDAQQRTDPDQSEAVRRTPGAARRTSFDGCSRQPPTSTASRCTCSRCRT